MRKSEIARKTGGDRDYPSAEPGRHGAVSDSNRRGLFGPHADRVCPHGSFDLAVQCQGDTWVDDHHTVEDVGICLGQAFAQALGDLRGWSGLDTVFCPWTRH